MFKRGKSKTTDPTLSAGGFVLALVTSIFYFPRPEPVEVAVFFGVLALPFGLRALVVLKRRHGWSRGRLVVMSVLLAGLLAVVLTVGAFIWAT